MYTISFPVFNKTDGSVARGERFSVADIRTTGGKYPRSREDKPSFGRRELGQQKEHQGFDGEQRSPRVEKRTTAEQHRRSQATT